MSLQAQINDKENTIRDKIVYLLTNKLGEIDIPKWDKKTPFLMFCESIYLTPFGKWIRSLNKQLEMFETFIRPDDEESRNFYNNAYGVWLEMQSKFFSQESIVKDINGKPFGILDGRENSTSYCAGCYRRFPFYGFPNLGTGKPNVHLARNCPIKCIDKNCFPNIHTCCTKGCITGRKYEIHHRELLNNGGFFNNLFGFYNYEIQKFIKFPSNFEFHPSVPSQDCKMIANILSKRVSDIQIPLGLTSSILKIRLSDKNGFCDIFGCSPQFHEEDVPHLVDETPECIAYKAIKYVKDFEKAINQSHTDDKIFGNTGNNILVSTQATPCATPQVSTRVSLQATTRVPLQVTRATPQATHQEPLSDVEDEKEKQETPIDMDFVCESVNTHRKTTRTQQNEVSSQKLDEMYGLIIKLQAELDELRKKK